MRRRTESAQTLVASLIVIAIILILVVVMFKGSGAFGSKDQPSPRKDGLGTTVIGGVKYAAKDEVCRSNLSQVRSAIEIFKTTNDDQPPATLADTRIGNDFYQCPIGHEPYRYDPTTGRVTCPHPGHESF
ncbi:MAG TPA: hypothetical protein VG944_17595 [Fimbriimonas sp.]|nr:hypothetical protein [Fimbriimonas sp.]